MWSCQQGSPNQNVHLLEFKYIVIYCKSKDTAHSTLLTALAKTRQSSCRTRRRPSWLLENNHFAKFEDKVKRVMLKVMCSLCEVAERSPVDREDLEKLSHGIKLQPIHPFSQACTTLKTLSGPKSRRIQDGMHGRWISQSGSITHALTFIFSLRTMINKII